MAPRTRRLRCKTQDDGTYGTKVPISIFSSLHTCDFPAHKEQTNIRSTRTFCATSHTFCNRCWSTACKHSPGISADGKLSFPFSTLGPVIDSGVRSSNSVIKLSVYSYNCMSLKESDNDAVDAVKLDFQSRALLRQNLSQKHYHVIGLQEARTNDRTFAIPGYQCVASGHLHKNFGVELWLSSVDNIVCVNPVTGGEAVIGFDLEQLVIVHKEPRLLIVSVGIQSEAVVFVVLHAPDQTHGIIKVTAWWNKFFSLVTQYSIDMRTAVVLGDFNLRFGSRTSKAVGNHYNQKQHSGARPLHKWMLDHNLFLPSTFPGHQDTSPAHTYIHSSGSLHRIDYIMLPNSTSTYPYETGTYDPEFSSITDHIGTWVSFSLPLRVKHRIPKSKIGYDPSLFADPVRATSFQNEMALGTFDPHMFHDSTSRYHYYTTFTYYALCHNFPTSTRAPIKPYISLHTTALIADRNRARALLKHVKLNPHGAWWLPGIEMLAARFKACVRAVRRSACRDYKNYSTGEPHM